MSYVHQLTIAHAGSWLLGIGRGDGLPMRLTQHISFALSDRLRTIFLSKLSKIAFASGLLQGRGFVRKIFFLEVASLSDPESDPVSSLNIYSSASIFIRFSFFCDDSDVEIEQAERHWQNFCKRVILASKV